jgi:hypothetical protein
MTRALVAGSSGIWLWLCCALALGCDELAEFRTGDEAMFRGEVIGSDSEEGQSSFIRQGFESHTRIDMRFDPARASAYSEGGAAEGPIGAIDTYVCAVEQDPCPPAQRNPGHFTASALELIPNLTHDALSQYDFPGGGRLRNYIFVSRFALAGEAGSGQGAAMVFVSLMDNRSVELRVIAPGSPATEAVSAQPALFGVFVLERHAL